MSGSWRIGRIAGIDVYVHFTFTILLAWVAIYHYQQGGNLIDVANGIVFIIALFGIIVLHELGHALTARRFGIPTKDITLLPIGGVARLQRMPDDPRQELLVAVAGPAVNVVLAIACFIVLLLLGLGFYPLESAMRVGGNFVAQMLYVNVMLVLFNMLPAFPMDGGRVLRALLAIWGMNYVRATQVAAAVGQGMAVLFVFVGLTWPNYFLIFIAFFVWLGASQESSMVQMRDALGGISVRQAMITDFRTLRQGDPLARAIENVLAGFQQDFPVVDDEDQIVGVLTRGDMVSALSQHGSQARVEDFMQRKFVTAEPQQMLPTALIKLQDCNCRTLPVVENGRLLGLMTSDNLTEVLMIQDALRQAKRPRPLA